MGDKPRTIGKYQIKSLLGEGATSIVFEGFDPDIERRVAIKLLRPNLINGKVGKELLARFKREAISAARCIHPNVVTILEYGQHGEMPYMVMEYIDGVSVQSLLKQRRPLPLKRILTIVSQLLRALHAAHRLSIVHRDVKASNVLILKRSGRVKLADFGMARIMESPDLTMIGSLIGTPRYMAPELRLGLEADSRADVFSATRLFLELLRLMPPDSPFPRSQLPDIVNMPPGNRINFDAYYPTALIPVLLKGLDVDRKERFQTVRELMQAIKQALPDLQQHAVIPKDKHTGVALESADEIPATEDELDSMTSLLADFMGPIATLIMEEHETRSASAQNLAEEISKEIPERDKQAEFLKRWESLSLSRREFFSQQRPQPRRNEISPRKKGGEMLERIGIDFAHYIGPIADTLLRQHSARSENVEDLVKSLGEEIPDQKQSQKFIKSWLRN